MSKRWNHKTCAEHVKVGAMRVCILPGDNREEVIRFAEEVEHIQLHRKGRAIEKVVL